MQHVGHRSDCVVRQAAVDQLLGQVATQQSPPGPQTFLASEIPLPRSVVRTKTDISAAPAQLFPCASRPLSRCSSLAIA
eukprot:15470404-Alexandrium_andersonii.AAC.1